jgi:hypothetical protein
LTDKPTIGDGGIECVPLSELYGIDEAVAQALKEERERIARKLRAKGFVDFAEQIRKGEW